MDMAVIHLVSPSCEVAVEIAERPHGMLLGIDGLCDLTNVFSDLGVAGEGMDKLGIRCAKKSLDDRSIPWLCPGSAGLGAGVVRQECLKIDTAKIGATTDDQCVRD